MSRYESEYNDASGIAVVLWVVGGSVAALLLIVGLVFAFAGASVERPLNDIHRDAVTHAHAYIVTKQREAQRDVAQARGIIVKRDQAKADGDVQLQSDEASALEAKIQEIRGDIADLSPQDVPQDVTDFLSIHGSN